MRKKDGAIKEFMCSAFCQQIIISQKEKQSALNGLHFAESLYLQLKFPLRPTCCGQNVENVSTSWDQAKPLAVNYNNM